MSFEGWQECEIGDYFDLIPGYAFKSKEFLDQGAPVFKIKNIKPLNVKYDELAYVSESYLNLKSKFIVKKDELLISMTGNRIEGTPETWVGKVAYFNKEEPYLVNQRVGILRKKGDSQVSNKYMVYKLSTDEMQKHLISIATSSGGQANISPTQILSTRIKLPSFSTQEKTAFILSSFDDKIELNNRMNKVLEQMAQAIFKQWFVDFEFPNENGEPYKSSGGEMVWCEELGKEIPKGWMLDTIGNCSSFLSRGIAPKYAEVSDKYVINQKCIRNGELNLALSRPHVSNVSEEKQIRFGDILVNSTGTGTLGRVAQVYERLNDYTVDSHVTIIRPNLKYGIGYMGCLVKSMQSTFENAATGSTGQTELGREVIKQMKIIVPEQHLIKAFSDIYHNFCEKMVRSQQENKVLTSLRDTLLPKLMSEEIDVSEIDV